MESGHVGKERGDEKAVEAVGGDVDELGRVSLLSRA